MAGFEVIPEEAESAFAAAYRRWASPFRDIDIDIEPARVKLPVRDVNL